MGAIQDILTKFGNDTVTIIRSNLASTGTNASGETSNSVQSQTIGDNRVQVSGKPFIMVVETGRKEGKMPPVSQIRKWLETGKVSFEGEIESAAWAISKAIAKNGSKLYQMGGRRDVITPAISDQRVNVLTDQIADIALNKTIEVIERATDGEER
jgi:hypothetical protein